MSVHIIAISTYGSQRITDPDTGKTISAYKLGYTSAVTAVLLALYRTHARRITPPRATYHYLQINAEVIVRHGFILVTLTPDELEQVVAVTRQYRRAAVYLWREGAWWALPDQTHPDYTTDTGSSPRFDPTGLRPPSPSTGERETSANGITIEKSQRSPSETPWFWISGDTYPHRDLLKRHGARFSGKRKAWYLVAHTLPDAIQALATTAAEPHNDEGRPDTSSSLLAIFGGHITGKERAASGDLIVKGANGIFATRTTWITRNEQEQPVWEFDLPPQARVGDSLPAMQKALQSNSPRYSLYTRKWHFDQPDKIATLDALVERVPFTNAPADSTAAVPAMSPALAAQIEQVLAEDDARSQPETLEKTPIDEAPSAPAVRITKPQPLTDEPDAMQTAIRHMQSTPPPARTAVVTSGRRALIPIPQQPVGELTGSITGSVWCYGYAVHEGVCIFLNCGGPRMAVEAIRAKLSKGDIVSVVPDDAPSVELTAGEGSTGMYTAFMHNLPEARFTSLILVHEQAASPNYSGKSITFIFRVSDAQATMQLKHHVTELVKVPVFDAWADYLYHAGQGAMLVRKTRGAGGLDVLAVDLDTDAWTRLITGVGNRQVIRNRSGDKGKWDSVCDVTAADSKREQTA